MVARMENIKAHVQSILEEIQGVNVCFFYPNDFKKLPIISFYENATKDGRSWDNVVTSKDCIIQVDVWASKYTQADAISFKVDEIMQADGWNCQLMSDIPRKDEKEPYHRTMRYRKQLYL